MQQKTLRPLLHGFFLSLVHSPSQEKELQAYLLVPKEDVVQQMATGGKQGSDIVLAQGISLCCPISQRRMKVSFYFCKDHNPNE